MVGCEIDLRNARLGAAELRSFAKTLRGSWRDLVRKPEGEFLRVVDDARLLREIRAFARKRPGGITDVVQLGIGGSSLGGRALCEALLPARHNERIRAGRGLRFHFPDNIDPESFGALAESLDPGKTLVHVVSKSGGTLETHAQLHALRRAWGTRAGRAHYVATTGARGALRDLAEKEERPILTFPEDVSGRFSVFTASGLLVPALCGIAVNRVLAGARAAVERCRRDSLLGPAGRLAAIHYAHDTEHGRPIHVEMIYADALVSCGHWFGQIWAESLGKNGRGPTPVVARGTTDQHSQIQLYMEGPDDKLFTFVRVGQLRSRLAIGADAGVEVLRNVDLSTVFDAEARGTSEALVEKGRPLLEIRLPKITPESVGELLMLQQIQTALAGGLYGVYPFDQPGVEAGKRAALRILERRGAAGKRGA